MDLDEEFPPLEGSLQNLLDQTSLRCRCSDCDLYCVNTRISRRPERRQFASV